MDPITILSTVASTVKVAYQLSDFISRVQSASDEIRMVAAEVRNLSNVLETLQSHFSASSTYTSDQLSKVNIVVSDTEIALNALTCIVKEYANPGVFGRLKWSLDNGASLDKCRKNISSCTSILGILVATLADHRGANIEDMVQQCLGMLQGQAGSTVSLSTAARDRSNTLRASTAVVMDLAKQYGIKIRSAPWMVPTIFLNSVRLPGSGTVRINQDDRKHNVKIEVEMENGTTLCGKVTKGSSIDACWASECSYYYMNGRELCVSLKQEAHWLALFDLKNEEGENFYIHLAWPYTIKIMSDKKVAKEFKQEFEVMQQLPKSWFPDGSSSTSRPLAFRPAPSTSVFQSACGVPGCTDRSCTAPITPFKSACGVAGCTDPTCKPGIKKVTSAPPSTASSSTNPFQSPCGVPGCYDPNCKKKVVTPSTFKSACGVPGCTDVTCKPKTSSPSTINSPCGVPGCYDPSCKKQVTTPEPAFKSACGIPGCTDRNCKPPPEPAFKSACGIPGCTDRNCKPPPKPAFKSACGIPGCTDQNCKPPSKPAFKSACGISGCVDPNCKSPSSSIPPYTPPSSSSSSSSSQTTSQKRPCGVDNCNEKSCYYNFTVCGVAACKDKNCAISVQRRKKWCGTPGCIRPACGILL